MNNKINRLHVPNVYPVARMLTGKIPHMRQVSGLTIGRGKDVCLVGNHAVAIAAEQAMIAAKAGQTAAFPITPATEILHHMRQMEADGKIPSIGYNSHSEHEAMSAAIGSNFGQVRSFIATSSVGFLHMYEMVAWAAQNRVNAVMALSNREDAPLNIWYADSDRIRARDITIQLVAENHQQSYDLTLQAFRIAEDAGWLTIMNLAGFFISHSSDKFKILDEETAINFVGPYKINHEIDPFTKSVSKGGLASPIALPLQRAQNLEAWSNVKDIVLKVHDEYGEISGRAPGAFFNSYYADEHTKYLFLNYGFLSGTLRTAVEILRRNGIPAGLISGTLYRPFPDQELVEAMSKMPNLKIVGAFDGSIDPVPGATYSDAGLALFRYWSEYSKRKAPLLMNFKFGGGQNPSLSVINGAFIRMKEAAGNKFVEYAIQQLDRNSEGGRIALDETNKGVQQVLSTQTIVEFVGRGGLGAISSAANLAATTNESPDLFARGIPQFGSEKTGSPTFGIAVKDNNPITNYNIEGPRNSFVFFRPDLITQKHVENLKEDGFFLVNTGLSIAEIRKRYKIPSSVKIYAIDASKMAKQVLKKDFPNYVLLSALSKISPDLISLEQIEGAIRRSLRKKGEKTINANITLINKTAENLVTEENIQ